MQIVRNAPIFVCAFMIKKYSLIRYLKKKYCALIILVTICLSFIVLIDKGSNLLAYPPPLYRICIGFNMSYLWLLAIYMLYRINFLRHVIILLGERSLGVYMLHFILFLFLFPKEFYTDEILTPYWSVTIFMSIIFTAVSCFLVKLSMKSSILRKYFLGYKS